MSKAIDLSIIIPSYKEAERLGKTLTELASYLRQHDSTNVEVIVAVTSSPGDQTATVARQHSDQFKHLHVNESSVHQGKGRAVAEGMAKARGDYKMFMDADLATPLHHLESVGKYMKGGSDVIIGVRDLNKIHTGFRKLMSTFGNLLVKVLLGLGIKDTQCGFKAFRSEVAKDLFKVQRITGWGFDMELLAVAKRRGYSLATIPIDDWRDVAGGTISGSPLKAAISTFMDLFKIRWNLWMGKYGPKQAKR